jgi:DNA replication protein
MEKFAGFPAGRLRFTSVPDLFFSELLPAIDDLAELKVTLHVLWLLHRKQGGLRFVSRRELEADPTLLRSLGGGQEAAKEALDRALAKATERGTLLHIFTRQEGDEEPSEQAQHLYLLNNAEGRQAVERIRRGELPLQLADIPGEAALSPERPNIFTLYEQNIGLLSPLIADELREAEQQYPPDWIEEAFKRAVENNVRKWSYVRAILESWAAEGKDGAEYRRDSEKKRRWYTDEEYEKYFIH